MLGSRFESLPGAFNEKLIPLEKSGPRKKGFKAVFSSKFEGVSIFVVISLV